MLASLGFLNSEQRPPDKGSATIERKAEGQMQAIGHSPSTAPGTPAKPLPVLKAADRAIAQQLAVEKQERCQAIANENKERCEAIEKENRERCQAIEKENKERNAAIESEKAERTQAMQDLLAKFQRMEQDLNEVKSRASAASAAAAAPVAAAVVAVPQDSNNKSLEELRVSLQASAEEQKTQLKLTEDGINRKLEAHMKDVDALAEQQRSATQAVKSLEDRLKTTEDQSNSISSKVEAQRTKSSAIFQHMSGRSKAWMATCTQPPLTNSSEFVSVDMAPNSYSSRSVSPTKDNSSWNGNGSMNDVAAPMSPGAPQSGKNVESWVRQLESHVMTIRTVLLELHVSIGVHAVKMTHTALMTFELSRSERQAARVELEAKETQLRADLVRVRAKTRNYTDQLLRDILNKDEQLEVYLDGKAQPA